MRPASFTVIDATSIEDSINALSDYPSGARILAGGQDLIGELNQRKQRITTLIDVRKVPALHGVHQVAGILEIGATMRQREIERMAVWGAAASPLSPVLAKVASAAGPRAVRTLGTVGGNVASTRPGTLWPAVLSALGSTIRVARTSGVENLPAPEGVALLHAREEPSLAVSMSIPDRPARLVVMRAPLPTESYPVWGLCAIALPMQTTPARIALAGPGGIVAREIDGPLHGQPLPRAMAAEAVSPITGLRARQQAARVLAGLSQHATSLILQGYDHAQTSDGTVVVNAASPEPHH